MERVFERESCQYGPLLAAGWTVPRGRPLGKSGQDDGHSASAARAFLLLPSLRGECSTALRATGCQALRNRLRLPVTTQLSVSFANGMTTVPPLETGSRSIRRGLWSAGRSEVLSLPSRQQPNVRLREGLLLPSGATIWVLKSTYESTLYETIMVDSCHTSGQAHGVDTTKSEPHCPLWPLGDACGQCRLSAGTNVARGWGMVTVREAVQLWGRGLCDISVSSSQVCCKPNTALKKIKS